MDRQSTCPCRDEMMMAAALRNDQNNPLDESIILQHQDKQSEAAMDHPLDM
jgi:hypothetical protein